MKMVKTNSKIANQAYEMVEFLQQYFAKKLDNLSQKYGAKKFAKKVEWFRDEGRHGGGNRLELTDETLFNRGSINISQVHYDDDNSKRLGSANAISTIIHPKNPYSPSIHIHISWTQMKDETGYWRIMADLNPSIEDKNYTKMFDERLKSLSGSLYEEGVKEGDRYFYIPALNRTRGVKHFYLEGFNSGDFNKDLEFAKKFGMGVIDVYIDILDDSFSKNIEPNEDAKTKQLQYHTLYLFQVLTLDRGTTAGLLVHNQNDVGIMGSLPSKVDTTLLTSWIDKMQKPQDELLKNIIDAIDDSGKIDIDTKIKLANVVREHYKKYPNALKLQAQSSYIPPTIDNHTKN